MLISSSIKVLFIASEADPYIKVGGLADVAGSLPPALKEITKTGNDAEKLDIRLVIPHHPQIQLHNYTPKPLTEFPIRTDDSVIQAKVSMLEVDSLPVYLIGGDPIDHETGVYSANLEDDGFKYVFFSLACLELARQIGWAPDILHANDWHTAAAVYAISLNREIESYFSSTASLLTIHNLPYLGSMTPPAMEAFGLSAAEHSSLPTWARQMALPVGLLATDAIVAVSPGYAREILTEEFGSGLSAFLQAHREKISGILNGLDTQKWDPFADKDLARNFSSQNIEARASNKAFLQESLGLEINPQVPVLAMVTRMDPQKGVDLAVDGIRSILKVRGTLRHPFQMIFLGTGNPVLENKVRQLELDYPKTVHARIMFNEPLSRHIYAGADMLLMPSRYEPCGLSQMIAMHYGCIPIARATGGLSDTIQDPADTSQSTGFLFSPAKPEALIEAIQRAVTVYEQDPRQWQGMQLRGMLQDFSWERSANEYLKLYKTLLSKRKKV